MNTVFSYSRTVSGRRAAFATATVMFFLMCHGLFGASHALGSAGLAADFSGGGGQSHQMQMEGHAASASQDDAGGAASHEDGLGLVYASVIVASALAALLLFSLIRACFISWFAAPRGRSTFLYPKELAPCRGPTLPALQVFRL